MSGKVERARHHDPHGAPRLLAALRERRFEADGGIGFNAFAVRDVGKFVGFIGSRLAWDFNRRGKLGKPLEMAQEPPLRLSSKACRQSDE